MIKRVLIPALDFVAPACLVSAQDARVSVDMIGIGRMSCANWRSTQEHRLEGTIWIYGFWCRWLPECAQRWRTGEVTMARAAES
jgi:hypothetical protein